VIDLGYVLATSVAEIHRLDVPATDSVKPYAGATSGFDDDFRETVAYDDAPAVGTATKRKVARVDLPPVLVECQVESGNHERHSMKGPGNQPVYAYTLVVHRDVMEELGLLDPKTAVFSIKPNDRCPRILYGPDSEREGDVAYNFAPEPGDEGLYVHEVKPDSEGFGPAYSLVLIHMDTTPVVT
jgi:hypothetical protein